MNHRPLTLLSPLLAALCFGCASPKPLSESFRPGPAVMLKPAAPAILVVLEEDERPLKGRSHVGAGFLSWIPLVPYGHQQFSLATSGTKPFHREVSDTVIKDLRAAGLAEVVAYQDPNDPRQRGLTNAYTLHLTLKEGIWDRYLTLYGTSFAGALLWFVGFPTSYGNVLTDIHLNLKDSAGASLGEQTFKAKQGATEWLYRPFPPGRKLPKAYNQISPQMRTFVAEKIGKAGK